VPATRAHSRGRPLWLASSNTTVGCWCASRHASTPSPVRRPALNAQNPASKLLCGTVLIARVRRRCAALVMAKFLLACALRLNRPLSRYGPPQRSDPPSPIAPAVQSEQRRNPHLRCPAAILQTRLAPSGRLSLSPIELVGKVQPHSAPIPQRGWRLRLRRQMLPPKKRYQYRKGNYCCFLLVRSGSSPPTFARNPKRAPRD